MEDIKTFLTTIQMNQILQFFVLVFLALTALSITFSIIGSVGSNFSKNCRWSAFLSFMISVLLLYFWYVLP